jgi:hypothetical protein
MGLDPVLSSTLVLTLLLMVGLAFFIRASTKDRTESALFVVRAEEVALLEQLQGYFEARAYRVSQIEPSESRITLQGLVGASVFLAVFLSLMAAVGLGCIALVLGILFPEIRLAFAILVLLAPLAGFFYWRGATRPESVTIQIKPLPSESLAPNLPQTQLWVSAHRDEILAMQAALPLKQVEAASH